MNKYKQNQLAVALNLIINRKKKKAIINDIKEYMVEQLGYSTSYVTQVTLNKNIVFGKDLENKLLKIIPSSFAKRGLNFNHNYLINKKEVA